MRMITKKMLAVAPAASNDPTRYVLQSVFIEETQTGAVATATNGRILARVTRTAPEHGEVEAAGFPVSPALAAFQDAKNGGSTAIVPAAAVKDIVRGMKKSSLPILHETAALKIAAGENGLAVFASTDLDQVAINPVRPLAGCYPNYKQVIPEGPGKLEILFDVALLIDLLKIAQTVGGKGRSVKLTFTDALHPARVEIKDGEGHEFLGVIMPMREPKTNEQKAAEVTKGREEIRNK